MTDLSYYEENYRNYELQNPPRKLRFFRKLMRLGLGQTDHLPKLLDVGCAFGRFLEYVSPEVRYYLHVPTRIFRNHTPAIAVVARPRS
jgi:hypothetical protein